MTREFRGLRVDNGEWIYGYYGWSMGKHYITEIINEMPSSQDPGGCYIENFKEVEGETVTQYIGLIDNQNKQIFEGDIVEYAGERKGKVIYKDAEFLIEKIIEEGELYQIFSFRTAFHKVRVIGNAFDMHLY